MIIVPYVAHSRSVRHRGQLLLSCQLPHLCQHILNEYTVADGGVVDENVGHGAYDLSVLQDGGAGHPLHDAACLFEEGLVGDLNGKALGSLSIAVDV